MAVSTLIWKLASPYDAYVSHVARLHEEIDRLRALTDRALGYEAGLQGSIRLVPSRPDPEERGRRLRALLAERGAAMSDQEMDQFVAHLGGGDVAEVERSRAVAFSRLGDTTRVIARHFARAVEELEVLEKRGYSPARADVARQLRENGLPAMTTDEYRQLLRKLGAQVGQKA